MLPSQQGARSRQNTWCSAQEIFDKWDPEKPRDYNNFNPFERNDEAQQCDKNGCFPGQSRGCAPAWPSRMHIAEACARWNMQPAC